MNSRPIIPRGASRTKALLRVLATFGFAIAALAANPTVQAQTTPPALAELHRGDQRFVRNLIQRTEQNLAAAKLAESDASDPRVRRFAATRANRDQDLDRALTDIADAHHFVTGLPAESRWKWTDELRKAGANEFDQKFLGRAIDAHLELLGALKDAADEAKDPVLRDIVQSRVAPYKEIVDQAEELKGELRQAPGRPGRGHRKSLGSSRGSPAPARPIKVRSDAAT